MMNGELGSYSQSEYFQSFDSAEYLRQYYSRAELTADDREIFAYLHRWLKASPTRLSRMIDIGCGPTLHNSFAVSPFVDLIDYADLLPVNLTAIRDWNLNSPTAHDWTNYFREIVCQELNDDPATNSWKASALADIRIQKFRQNINQLFLCDLLDASNEDGIPLRSFASLRTEENPHYETSRSGAESYDLLTTFFCPECIATSVDQWSDIIRRMTGLLKPAGRFFMALIKECHEYRVLDRSFPALPLNENIVQRELQNIPFERMEIHVVDSPAWKDDGFEQIILVAATKMR